MTHPVEKSSSSPAAYPAPAVSVEEISAIATLIQNRSYRAASDAIQRVIPRLPISTYTTPVSTQFCGLAQNLKQEMLDSIETEDFVHAACLGKIIARMCVADETFNRSHGGRMFVYDRDIRDPLIESLTDDPELEHRFRFWLEGQSPNEHPFFTSFENPPVRVPPPRPAPLPVAPPVAPSHARSAPLAAPPPAYLFEEGFAQPMRFAPAPRPEDAYDDEVEPPAGFGSRAAQPPLPHPAAPSHAWSAPRPQDPPPRASGAAAPVPAPRVSASPAAAAAFPPRVSAAQSPALNALNRKADFQHLPRFEFDGNAPKGVTEASAQRFRQELTRITTQWMRNKELFDRGQRHLEETIVLDETNLASMSDYLQRVRGLLPPAQGEALYNFATQPIPLPPPPAPLVAEAAVSFEAWDLDSQMEQMEHCEACLQRGDLNEAGELIRRFRFSHHRFIAERAANLDRQLMAAWQARNARFPAPPAPPRSDVAVAPPNDPLYQQHFVTIELCERLIDAGNLDEASELAKNLLRSPFPLIQQRAVKLTAQIIKARAEIGALFPAPPRSAVAPPPQSEAERIGRFHSLLAKDATLNEAAQVLATLLGSDQYSHLLKLLNDARHRSFAGTGAK